MKKFSLFTLLLSSIIFLSSSYQVHASETNQKNIKSIILDSFEENKTIKIERNGIQWEKIQKSDGFSLSINSDGEIFISKNKFTKVLFLKDLIYVDFGTDKDIVNLHFSS